MKGSVGQPVFWIAVTAITPCSAGTVTSDAIALDEGNVTALLENTSQRFVDAMQRLVTDGYRDEYSARRWEAVETHLSEERVARLEYRFGSNGNEGVRIYHAMGGEPLGTFAQETFHGPSRPPSTTSSEASSGGEEDPDVRASRINGYASQDMDDARWFTEDDGLHVRAGIQRLESSAFHPYEINGGDRALDPEFKALATLERDITEGAVPRGGSIRLLVSAETCTSCQYAFAAAARAYDVDIQVTRIVPAVAPIEQRALISSGTARLKGPRLVDVTTGRPLLAADNLAAARVAQVRQALSPNAMQRRFRGISWVPRAFREAAPPAEPTVPNERGCE
jgi:hypothetical protein